MASLPDSETIADNIRRKIIQMTNLSGASHVGSGLSIADILAVLYRDILNISPDMIENGSRDRFILSKGHAAAALYAALSEVGLLSENEVLTHCANGSRLMGHASHHLPGVEFSTGSLGHGLPVGGGMALADQLDGKSRRVIVLLSDGECDEGSNWEAIMFAGFKKLRNLMAVVDYNKIQSLRSTAETLDLEPFADKWQAFGWAVEEVDGHNHDDLKVVLGKSDPKGRPTVVICHTTKGKGVSFMENSVLWHYRAPKNAEYDAAMAELNASSNCKGD